MVCKSHLIVSICRVFTCLALILLIILGIDRVQALEPKIRLAQTRTLETVKFLINIGPRTPDSSAIEAARHYLSSAYEQAGYFTEVQPFNYQNFQVLPSSLTVGSTRLRGNAIQGSSVNRVVGSLVPVLGTGNKEDFTSASVHGAISVIRRSNISVSEQVQNAVSAGAKGLIVVNSEAGNWTSRFTNNTKIPVLALSGEQGESLFAISSVAARKVILDVQPIWRTTTGHNLIARSHRVILPRIVIGAHYDSVSGSVGANDNASGIAVMLELARRLADTPLAQWIWFVAFDAEELGVAGSQALLASLPYPFKLRAMMNIEMVGLNDQLLVTGTPSLTSLAKKVAPSVSVVSDLGLSDHYPFQEKDIPVIVLTRGLHPNKDTPLDTKVNPDLLNETVEIAEKIVKELLPILIQ